MKKKILLNLPLIGGQQKIEATENENEANLNLFKNFLYNKLLSEIIQKSSVLISTINCQNYMLDELVYISGILLIFHQI